MAPFPSPRFGAVSQDELNALWEVHTHPLR